MRKSLIATRPLTYDGRRIAKGEEFTAPEPHARVWVGLRKARLNDDTATNVPSTHVPPGAPPHIPEGPDMPEPNRQNEPRSMGEPTQSPASEENCDQRVERVIDATEQQALEAEPAQTPRRRRYRRRDIAPTETK